MAVNAKIKEKLNSLLEDCKRFDRALESIEITNLNGFNDPVEYDSSSTDWRTFKNRATSFFSKYKSTQKMIEFGHRFDEILMYNQAANITSETISDLIVLFNDISDYLDDEDITLDEGHVVENTNKAKQKKLLISHNSKDRDYCDAVVNLLDRIGLTEKEVICTSVTGYGIKLNEDIYDWLRTQFDNDLYVIFMLSDNYYDSPASLNEMGAAWVMQKKYTSVILPGFDIGKIQGAVNPRQMALVLENSEDELRQKLSEMRDILVDEFGLDEAKPSEARWNRAVKDFIESINSISEKREENIKGQNKGTPVNFNEADSLIPLPPAEEVMKLGRYALILLAYASKDPQAEIEEYKDIRGHHLITNSWDFIGSDDNPRIEAIWMDALDKLIKYNYIKLAGKKDHIYKLTSKAFAVADEFIDENGIDVDMSPTECLNEENDS